jgi:hypothetical protein
MVGMAINTQHLPNGDGLFFEPANMALINKELDYLQSIGMRIIHINLFYVRWFKNGDEITAYTMLLDAIYKHKMLAIPLITAKWIPGFLETNEPDFSWNFGSPKVVDTLRAWANRWVAIVGKYSNIIAVVIDNELDYKLGPPEVLKRQRYTVDQVDKYLVFMKNILAKANVPMITKLMGNEYWGDDAIKLICLSKTDLPVFDCYANSTKQENNDLSIFFAWLKKSGHPIKGWWCLEYNKGMPIDTAKFDSSYIDAIYNNGATVVTLFVSNYAGNPTWDFFNVDGTPTRTLSDISRQLVRLQSPINN